MKPKPLLHGIYKRFKTLVKVDTHPHYCSLDTCEI